MVFEVVVDHLKRIMAVSRVHRGTINDKSIVRLDDFVQKLREGKVFMGVTYRLWKDDGTYDTRNDPYLLVDGGYHKWKQLQAVMQHLSDKWQRALSCIQRPGHDFVTLLHAGSAWRACARTWSAPSVK